MKDLNLLEINASTENKFIQFNDQSAYFIAFQLQQDAEFVASFGLMDYSLLLVVEDVSKDFTSHDLQKESGNIINERNDYNSKLLIRDFNI